ncbi:MAG: flagellar hook-length control protein FliK [Armatimonadota bacterium]
MQIRAVATSDPPPREAPTVTLRPVHPATSLELTEERPQRLTLEVDPPELGRCALELSLHEGRVRASVITERAETALALRAVESQVREQLAAREMHIAEFDIRADTHSSGQQSFGRGASHGGGTRQSSSEPPTRPEIQRSLERDTAARSSLQSAHTSTIDLVA